MGYGGHRNKSDGNQKRHDKLARDLGAVVIPTNGDPSIGFDRIYAYRGKTFLVETKDGPGHDLTPKEKVRREQLAAVGVTMHKIETDAQLLALLTGEAEKAERRSQPSNVTVICPLCKKPAILLMGYICCETENCPNHCTAE